jgi:cysteinyl-tRNA synthetase
VDELRRLLATELDVPAALDLAIGTGGGPARTLASVLGLS